MDTPTRVIAEIVTDYERQAATPLLLDPFFLESGRLIWQPDGDDDESWPD